MEAGDIRATARGGEACQGELTNKQANKPIFFKNHCIVIFIRLHSRLGTKAGLCGPAIQYLLFCLVISFNSSSDMTVVYNPYITALI